MKHASPPLMEPTPEVFPLASPPTIGPMSDGAHLMVNTPSSDPLSNTPLKHASDIRHHLHHRTSHHKPPMSDGAHLMVNTPSSDPLSNTPLKHASDLRHHLHHRTSHHKPPMSDGAHLVNTPSSDSLSNTPLKHGSDLRHRLHHRTSHHKPQHHETWVRWDHAPHRHSSSPINTTPLGLSYTTSTARRPRP